MEATKTIPEEVIPSSITEMNIISINIEPATKSARVEVYENGNVNIYSTDLTDEWIGVSETNKTIIRTFLKRVVQLCLTVSNTDITGDAL